MQMSLEKLKAIVAPPEKPTGAGTPQGWRDVENKLGTTLPDDYKAIVDCYGIGWFGNWICLDSPFYEFSFPKRHYDICASMRHSIESDPESFPPYPLFPAKGGLLFFGHSDNCDPLCFVTEGKPNKWPIVTMDNKYLRDYYDRFEMGLADFLVKWLSGRIEGECIRKQPSRANRVFIPGRHPDYKLLEDEVEQ
jgi:hypothetical protein